MDFLSNFILLDNDKLKDDKTMDSMIQEYISLIWNWVTGLGMGVVTSSHWKPGEKVMKIMIDTMELMTMNDYY